MSLEYIHGPNHLTNTFPGHTELGRKGSKRQKRPEKKKKGVAGTITATQCNVTLSMETNGWPFK